MTAPDLVVSVCDRAGGGAMPFDAPRLQWSIADPLGSDCAAFEGAFHDISTHVDRLADAMRS